MIAPAKRIQRIPPYLFFDLEKKMAELKRTGKDVISFTIGDPDLPPPPQVIQALREAVEEERNHKYSSSEGERFLREAIAEWYKIRFRVSLDPETEICVLLGSKEGLANIARGFVDPGETVLVPDPAYPVYANGAALLCDGKVVTLPLREERGFLPELKDQKGRLLYLNYPNNPTGATTDVRFLREVVDFTRNGQMLLAYDNPYSEVTYDGYVAPSVLEVEGAKETAVEFHSLSKTFNMTGDRLGFAVGNREAIAVLKKVKSQLDSGASPYVQRAAVVALALYEGRDPPAFVRKRNEIWGRRLALLCQGLNKLGYPVIKPRGTFYLFLKVGGSSLKFTEELLERGVAVTPGTGFGSHGEGYVRMAVVQSEERIRVALERMGES